MDRPVTPPEAPWQFTSTLPVHSCRHIQENCSGSFGEDVAIGAPGEDIGVVADAGVVNALYGDAAGLGSSGNQLWRQNSASISDTAEPGDTFGSALGR